MSAAGKRLALFAHYDAEGEVKRYVLHFLSKLRDECDEVVFLSTAALSETELGKARRFATRAAVMENRGYDFGMWQRAVAETDLTSWDEVVLTNSSVFGPIAPLGASFEAMQKVACDFWAMTDNVEIAWHLQSYFLVFKSAALRSGHVGRFFASVLPYRTKNQVIRSYEVGLTTYLAEQGFAAAALVPMAKLGRSGAPLPSATRGNPTVYHPARLLALGMPFVKVELLRDNPANVPLDPVRRRMREAGFDMTMIEFDRPKVDRDKTLFRLLRSRRPA